MFFVMVLAFYLPFTQSYNILRGYDADTLQIEPPRVDTSGVLNGGNIRTKKDMHQVSREYSGIPFVLMEVENDVMDEDLGYNPVGNGYGTKDPTRKKGNDVSMEWPNLDTSTIYNDAEEAEQFIDIPPGIPESETEVPGEPLTPQDFENAENLEILVPPQDEDSPDPILSAGLFEGDIAGVNISDFSPYSKNAIRDLRKRWPGGIIPYVISNSFSTYERSVIAAAVLDFHAYTCVRFVPRTTQRDYIHLRKGSGCSSLVGLFGGGQSISLGPGCLYKGIVEHELMHASGFWHEQSRGDRDEYVRILWSNIVPGNEHNFQKFGWNEVQTLGIRYDTGSLMHYGRHAFSRDYRSPTIIPRNPNANIGQRRGFSESDLLKINRLYECQKGIVIPMPTVPPPTYKCLNNNQLCQYWANIGECKKNPAWMKVNCAKSCRLCDFKCGNHNRNCDQWAKLGECTKNPDYMTIYCPQACHACSGANHEITGCKDGNHYCTAWAKNGQCRANPNYMLTYCRKACNQC